MPSASTRRQLLLSTSAMGLGLLAGCGRLPWQAQPAKTVYRVGYLGRTPELLRDGLQELGYVDGENLVFEHRRGGAVEQYPTIVAELVSLGVDVLVVADTEAAQAARSATSTVPVVFTVVTGPVEQGLVDSLAHPGGNLTGLSNNPPALSGKRLQLLAETVSGTSEVAVFWNPTAPLAFQAVQEAAAALHLQLHPMVLRGPDDGLTVLDALSDARPDAILVLPDPFYLANRRLVLDVVGKSRLPAMFDSRTWAQDGGLMAYGVNTADLQRRAALYVDKILKGAKPADLPVEQPMTFDFVVNMKTARELGITFPNEILLQVTEVIE